MLSFSRNLIRSGLSLLRRMDTDEPPVPASVFELHHAGDQREQRVVAASPDILSGLMLRAALPDQNRARIDKLPTETLYAQPLSMRIAAVG